MLLPVACRLVPYDQWLVTHLDDGSKVKLAKLWFLAKCNLVQHTGPHSQRSVSPIVFAPTVRPRSSIDSLDDGYSEDDEFSDQDLAPHRDQPPSKSAIYPHRDTNPTPSPQSPCCPLVDRYTLLSFSTGAILEDEFALSWYNLRPYELLEMHPLGILAPLQRDVLADYVQPYFQARVKLLRAVWNNKSGRFEAPGIDPQHDPKPKDKLANKRDAFSARPTTLQSDKKRKSKVDWKARWVVIHQGILFLCKDHVTNPPFQQFALNTMTALRGADALERAFPVVTQPRVVCIKFQPRAAPLTGAVSPPPSSPSSPISEELKISVNGPVAHVSSVFDLKQTAAESEDPGEYARHDSDDACRGEGEWVVLDMLDDHAFSSILRILHRHASHLISSSFVPSPSIITISHNSVASPAASSFASYDTIPYPEWRVNTVENARKAGMGDVGKAMAWVLWSERGLGESLLGNIRHRRQVFSQEMQYKTPVLPDIYCGSDDESDDESELEWEGWIRDLERQNRVKQQSVKTSRCAASSRQAPASTSLPSPPLSEASTSGSPRVRSPSLSVAHIAGSSFGPCTQYPIIGNVIQANEARSYCPTEHLQSPEKIKSTVVSTVSVGTAPSPRRRASTLLAELTTTKRDRDKGKQDREEPPRAPMNGTRANARTVSRSAGVPSTLVRHARSSSNLRVSSSPYGSDAAESTGYLAPSSPSKRQSAFMRGMSLRAGKLVRGLESAIDFVDEKSV